MKRTIKKLAATGLAITTVMSLVACGNSGTSDKDKTPTGSATEITKPESFKAMVDGTVVVEANGGQAFYDYIKEKTGINVEWIRPDHAGYYDAVANAFNDNEGMPDVIILSADYYALYAANGYLWDMTEAWNNSETKKSGRLISTAQNILDSLIVNGEDGKPAMYGYSPFRGNGCCTYVKETWLTAGGYTKAQVEGKTLTFKEYYDMLLKIQNATKKPVISSAGFIGPEAPYTNYLPEFYQKAQYTFYKDASGKYVDGFSEQAMKDALTRIAQGVKDGVIDQESVNNTTANARDKFYADNSGVFTYWAGTWAQTLKDNLQNKGLDSSLIALNPVKELGAYVERIAPTWCITSNAKNPEGIFKYWLDLMLDGGDVQTAWTYGVKGVHWDTKAETVTVQGKEDAGTAYTEGTFHFLPSPEKPNMLQTKNHIDPLLSLAKFTNGDPGTSQLPELAKTNMDFFANNSKVIMPVPMTEVFGDNISDINKQRNIIISSVATGKMNADEGVAEYTKLVGDKVEEVLKSLNK